MCKPASRSRSRAASLFCEPLQFLRFCFFSLSFWVFNLAFKVPMKWNFSPRFYSRKLKSMLHWLTIFEFKLWSGTQNNFSFPPRPKLENYGSEDHRLHQFSIKKVGENYTGSGCDMQKHSSDCGMWLVNQGDVSVTYYQITCNSLRTQLPSCCGARSDSAEAPCRCLRRGWVGCICYSGWRWRCNYYVSVIREKLFLKPVKAKQWDVFFFVTLGHGRQSNHATPWPRVPR